MTDVDRFLLFLGSRYAKARTELDEVRIRAMELVLAACVTELQGQPHLFRPPVGNDELASYADDDGGLEEFMPPRDPDATSELDVESYLKDELDWLEDPRPRRASSAEPPPTSEVDLPDRLEPSQAAEASRATVWEDETDDEPLTDATNWRSFSSADEEGAPEEPVRGAWEAPEN